MPYSYILFPFFLHYFILGLYWGTPNEYDYGQNSAQEVPTLHNMAHRKWEERARRERWMFCVREREKERVYREMRWTWKRSLVSLQFSNLSKKAHAHKHTHTCDTWMLPVFPTVTAKIEKSFLNGRMPPTQAAWIWRWRTGCWSNEKGTLIRNSKWERNKDVREGETNKQTK